MPHQCNHSHKHKQADLWTNVASLGEMTASFISDAYWLGNCLDIAIGLEAKTLGLSHYGLGLGIALAIISAGGAAYSHRALNTHHQNPKATSSATRGKQLLGSVRSVDHVDEEAPLNPKEHAHLTWLEKFALVGDFISHTGDIAGPITFVVNLASHQALPRWGKIVTQCAASFFGGFASVANVRTCKDAMLNATEHRCSSVVLN
jgi:hypothetical protein